MKNSSRRKRLLIATIEIADHSRRVREDAKANGMRKKLTDEEYWKEIVEIAKQVEKLEKMMVEESQRVGWLMKKKVKWNRLHMKKVQMIHAQQKERLLRMIEYLEKDLKTETSSETKRSNSLTSDKFCMFAGRTCGKEKTVDVVTEENETARCPYIVGEIFFFLVHWKQKRFKF